VYAAQINSSNHLEPWTLTTPLPGPVSNFGAVVDSGRVYVLGGWTGSLVVPDVVSAPTTPGGVGAWSAETSLPKPLRLQGATIAGGRLYVSGGVTNEATESAVYWTSLPDLTPPTAAFASVIPDPRSDAVSSISLGFSEPVMRLDLADLQLIRDGNSVGLGGASLSTGDGGMTWTVSNLAALTGDVGSYTLALTAAGSGIVDAAGNLLAGDASESWVMNAIVGTSGNGAIRLVRNGALTDYYVNDAYQYSFDPTLLPQLTINTGDGDDVLSIDFANGSPAGGIDFNGGAGQDALAVVGSPGADNVVFDAASVTLNVAINLINVEARTFDGGGGSDTLNVTAGTFTALSDLGAGTGSLTLNVAVGALATFNTTQHLAALVLDGGNATLAPGGNKALVLDALAIGGAGALNLNDNALLVRDGSFAAVQALVTQGFSGGAWNGAGGITSGAAATDPNGVTALGYADNAELGLTQFSGVTGLIGNEILVKYTYYGDADLSGVVDLDDFSQFLDGYQHQGTVTANWLHGDLDYSGLVDLDDFSQFLFGYQNQATPL
jgi:hypothetical protein